jgi:hypothetical protein
MANAPRLAARLEMSGMEGCVAINVGNVDIHITVEGGSESDREVASTALLSISTRLARMVSDAIVSERMAQTQAATPVAEGTAAGATPVAAVPEQTHHSPQQPAAARPQAATPVAEGTAAGATPVAAVPVQTHHSPQQPAAARRIAHWQPPLPEDYGPPSIFEWVPSQWWRCRMCDKFATAEHITCGQHKRNLAYREEGGEWW